jgi:hypothetical protein
MLDGFETSSTGIFFASLTGRKAMMAGFKMSFPLDSEKRAQYIRSGHLSRFSTRSRGSMIALPRLFLWLGVFTVGLVILTAI